ncbi:MAG: glutamate synthase-related protein [Bacilli bacterium]|nr:glutamate synthase-related protein [Bacilli bacterium]
MAKYKCRICGHIYDEAKEGVLFKDLPEDWKCPTCYAPKALFEKIEEVSNEEPESEETEETEEVNEGSVKIEDDREEYMQDIHTIATEGQSIITAMSTKKAISPWDDVLILGGQLATIPLSKDTPIKTTTIIGKNARKPMVLESPIYISHMSFGALSKEMKIALAKASALHKTAMCSGEGGILPEEKEASYKYIFEYVPNLYSVTEENLKNADAIEIKIGQGTKPGMGGHLPGEKVTEEIATIRGKKVGEDIISPSHFDRIKTKQDLKELVEELRERSEGRPIGVKIAAGHIEKDLEFIAYANPDFITIDGRGGATGASPKFVRDATSLPTLYALYRAHKYIKDRGLSINLVITGGLRISSDFAKALAMGADAVAIATSAMMAAGCQQYRICGSDRCPRGIATQDPELRKRFSVEKSSKQIFNFLDVSLEEMKTFARITGHHDLHDLSVEDLATTSEAIASHTDIPHV